MHVVSHWNFHVAEYCIPGSNLIYHSIKRAHAQIASSNYSSFRVDSLHYGSITLIGSGCPPPPEGPNLASSSRVRLWSWNQPQSYVHGFVCLSCLRRLSQIPIVCVPSPTPQPARIRQCLLQATISLH